MGALSKPVLRLTIVCALIICQLFALTYAELLIKVKCSTRCKDQWRPGSLHTASYRRRAPLARLKMRFNLYP